MRVIVDSNRCQGHALCVMNAPEEQAITAQAEPAVPSGRGGRA
jgi:ferredoxin